MEIIQSRRAFVAGASAVGAAGLIGTATDAWAEPPPETTTLRIWKNTGPAVCEAPKYVAADLLRAEGFTDVRYVDDSGVKVDFDTDFAPGWIDWMEHGERPWTVLAGLHSGCLQLMANNAIRGAPDLRGKRVGVDDKKSSGYRLAVLTLAYVGLDPVKDVEWIENDKAPLLELLADGKIDAFLSPPPDPQEVLARKIGHSILNTALDAPWSQYYCCMLAGTADFVGRYPIASKRVVRAILKAADICRAQPAVAARSVVDQGITEKYEYTLQGLTEVRYDRWRDFDSEDSVRFYALRMREVGFTKSSPEQIIAKGTDFHFLDELKRELKT